MFPYQRTGADWLASRDAALLADEMGLGKTLQTIAAVRALSHRGLAFKVLVACPKSLTRNWKAEFTRWGPELLVTLLDAPESWDTHTLASVFSYSHVVIANYEKLRLDVVARTAEVDILIADEAHKIRNISAGISQGARTVRASRRWALTGTPIERDVEDFAALLAFLDPLKFSLDDVRHPQSLRQRAEPYTLRRTRAAVLSDLPPVIEHNERLELAPAQRRAYEHALRDAALARHSYLALLGRLREICDFDSSTGQSSKIDRALELIDDIHELKEKAIIFSYLLEPLQLLAQASEMRGLREETMLFDGSLTSPERAQVEAGFKSKSGSCFLLASTRVTSEGLTLTEANHVIFLNQWWNPSSNRQARDRVVRIGQSRTVHVYVFTCEDTVEEKLEIILTTKDETYREIVDRLSSSTPFETPVDEELAREIIGAPGSS
jgi:SNF2 family DNA or RNA helicase